LYKSGKYYTLRSNIQSILDKPKLKIYNEDGVEVDFSVINNNVQLMTVLEIQGIRCSARSFQIEIEIKQIMVLKPNNLFDQCVFKPMNTNKVENLTIEKTNEIREPEPEHTDDIEDTPPIPDTHLDKMVDENKPADLELFVNTTVNHELPVEATEPNRLEVPIKQSLPFDTNDMQEVVFNLEELPETDKITLKKRNDVYYEMYREARKKAKHARDLALASYLEAKNIKNKYMLEDIDDSDESDLENDDESEYSD
jgi:hypothetical protein